jgi:twitching motility protein PilT
MSAGTEGLLGRTALRLGLITPEQLAHCIKLQGQRLSGQRLGDILVELGYLDDAGLRQVLDAQRERARPPAPPPEPAAFAAAASPRGHRPDFGQLHPRLAALLHDAQTRRASDVHLQAGSPPFLRVDGRIVRVPGEPPSADEAWQMLAALLPREALDRLARDGDLDCAWEAPSGGIRLRVNAFLGDRGHGAVLRVIPGEIPSLDGLGLPSIVAKMATFHQGLVLVSGPAGCGKSSTVAALIRLLNEERRQHVLLLEDPIEFVHPSLRCQVVQRQIPEQCPTFADALRSALREDPDVIVIGEMRDAETMALAVSAAETGHLVLATLHTADAAGTIERVITSFPQDQQSQVRAMISESLRGVICQRLLRRADGRGRVPALEILFNTPAVANLVREGRSFQIANILQTGRQLGMRRLQDAIEDLQRAGLVSAEEARRGAA